MSEHVARWLLQLNEFDIVVDSTGGCKIRPYHTTCEDICSIEAGECHLAFNGLSTHQGDKQDWRAPIIQILTQPSSIVVTKELKEFFLVNSDIHSSQWWSSRSRHV